MNDYKVHKSAGKLDEYNIEMLKALISEEGQIQPAILWFNGKEWVLVDGRHRLKVCNELNIELRVQKLPKKITEDELPRIILSNELAKRGMSSTYSVCVLVEYLGYKSEKITMKELAERYGVSHKDLSYVKKIKDVMPTWFMQLKHDKFIKIDENTITKSIRTIYDECMLISRLANRDSDEKDVVGSAEKAKLFKKGEKIIALIESEELEDVVLLLLGNKISKRNSRVK